MLEQRRCQRGASPEDNVPVALRLDAADAFDDVRSNALERTPLETFRAMRGDILLCRVETVHRRTARRLWPETRPDIIGATAEQQIEALAVRHEKCIPAGGSPIRRRPVAVLESVVIRGVLNHAVQRNVLHDLELSHLLDAAGIGNRSSSHACHTGVSRATVAAA